MNLQAFFPNFAVTMPSHQITPIKEGQTGFVIKELEEALRHGHAHATFEDSVKDIPHRLLGSVPDGVPYSLWQLVEHIRIAQWDMLEFSRDSRHKSPKWPEAYWPVERAPAVETAINRSIEQILSDREAFIKLLHEAGNQIYSSLEHGNGQSLFREALLIIDHNSYHIGEIILLRRLLGIWH
jgi:hypothetical protein